MLTIARDVSYAAATCGCGLKKHNDYTGNGEGTKFVAVRRADATRWSIPLANPMRK